MTEMRMYFESREECERTCARARGFESREAMLRHYAGDSETDDEWRARQARIQELAQ